MKSKFSKFRVMPTQILMELIRKQRRNEVEADFDICLLKLELFRRSIPVVVTWVDYLIGLSSISFCITVITAFAMARRGGYPEKVFAFIQVSPLFFIMVFAFFAFFMRKSKRKVPNSADIEFKQMQPEAEMSHENDQSIILTKDEARIVFERKNEFSFYERVLILALLEKQGYGKN